MPSKIRLNAALILCYLVFYANVADCFLITELVTYDVHTNIIFVYVKRGSNILQNNVFQI